VEKEVRLRLFRLGEDNTKRTALPRVERLGKVTGGKEPKPTGRIDVRRFWEGRRFLQKNRRD